MRQICLVVCLGALLLPGCTQPTSDPGRRGDTPVSKDKAARDKPAVKPAVAEDNVPEPLPGDWLLFRGSPQQAGFTTARVPDRLDVLWTFKAEDSFESAVAVAGGVVYAGSMDEHLYAIDLRTGKQKWKYKAGPFKAPPSVRGKYVYAGDLDSLLHCIDRVKGTKVWTFETGAEVGGANFNGDDVLFASHDAHLYCVSKAGKQKWKFKADGEVHGSVSIAQGRTFLVGCDSKLHVIDVNKGTEETSVDLGGQTAATAAVHGDLLYVGTMGNTVLAINWKKGEEVWTYKPEGGGQGFFASAAVNDRYVVIGGRDNRVHCIDRKTGKGVWTFPTGNKVDSSPVIAGSRVVVGSLDSKLYVLDLATGKEVTKVTLDNPISASPVVVGGRVLVGTQKGTLYCLGKK
jgi:outer membrane protein assembly factor BamB